MMLLLLACAADSAPPSPLVVPPAAPAGAPGEPAVNADGTPKVDTMLGTVPGVQYVGEWTSATCEGRAYPRNLVFYEHGEYAAFDLISPCPTGTSCIWSGIVGYAGIWKQDGTRLILREIGAPIEKGSPHPTEFVASFDGTLVENGCAYTKGITVPEGYTADKVRPRLPGGM